MEPKSRPRLISHGPQVCTKEKERCVFVVEENAVLRLLYHKKTRKFSIVVGTGLAGASILRLAAILATSGISVATGLGYSLRWCIHFSAQDANLKLNLLMRWSSWEASLLTE